MLSEIEKSWLSISFALAVGIFAALSFESYCALYWPFVVFGVFSLLLYLGLRKPYLAYLAVFFAGIALTFHSRDIKPELKTLAPWALEERRRFRGENAVDEKAEALKSFVSERITRGLNYCPRISSLACSLMLGEKAKMAKDDKRSFVDSGTLHVFAVSGLHVGVVALVIELVLLGLAIPYRLASALTIPLMWGYVYTVGMGASSVRAGVMLTTLLLSPVVFRRYNLIAAWSIAFVVFHVLEPGRLFEVGSALSFSITLAIIMYLKIVAGRDSRFVALTLSFIIWAASVPIMAYNFGRFTPGGLIANLFVVPLASLAVSTLSLSFFVSFVCPFVSVHLNNFAALMIQSMLDIARIIAKLPFSSFEVTRWSYTTAALWYVALILLMILTSSLLKHRNGIIHI